ncbi:uncharacterized protein BCR38DRAFT_214502 [Pseudomassariella vexata]|uniref:Secreted protein n=1 Tax=Pseudomassariella vexata TaxID=1141098 RepID=A0A1Y2DZA0_9PEZI|nr:uncharacterized protein BCR38DRAFT_214502 [Pseudomassariella vexata]ORY64424.1 hypothetical protein BCR38DRAFT_214502 [Pseudomassariella vexata]
MPITSSCWGVHVGVMVKLLVASVQQRSNRTAACWLYPLLETDAILDEAKRDHTAIFPAFESCHLTCLRHISLCSKPRTSDGLPQRHAYLVCDPVRSFSYTFIQEARHITRPLHPYCLSSGRRMSFRPTPVARGQSSYPLASLLHRSGRVDQSHM